MREPSNLGFDPVETFSRTLVEMCCEIFPRHGVESMPDEEFERMVRELTDRHYHSTLGEFRRRYGLSVVPKIRMPW